MVHIRLSVYIVINTAHVGRQLVRSISYAPASSNHVVASHTFMVGIWDAIVKSKNLFTPRFQYQQEEPISDSYSFPEMGIRTAKPSRRSVENIVNYHLSPIKDKLTVMLDYFVSYTRSNFESKVIPVFGYIT